MEALEKAQLVIQKIDNALKQVNFNINFKIQKVSIELTGNKNDVFGNSELMGFGFENQGFKINKQDI
jgi:hypothetical protein